MHDPEHARNAVLTAELAHESSEEKEHAFAAAVDVSQFGDDLVGGEPERCQNLCGTNSEYYWVAREHNLPKVRCHEFQDLVSGIAFNVGRAIDEALGAQAEPEKSSRKNELLFGKYLVTKARGKDSPQCEFGVAIRMDAVELARD